VTVIDIHGRVVLIHRMTGATLVCDRRRGRRAVGICAGDGLFPQLAVPASKVSYASGRRYGDAQIRRAVRSVFVGALVLIAATEM
jgi:hypothetical protein